MTQHPRVISIVILTRREREILVFEAFDESKNDWYYRPLGGGVEFGETSAQAAAREIREELGADVTDVRPLGVLENLFTCDGRQGHEIVFVYSARFIDPALYDRDTFDAIEDDGERMRVVWRRLDSFDATHRLVPERLVSLLQAPPS